MANPQLKLSVLIIAYNVEQFIAQALDSVLMQEINANYEVVIGEDCSTDRTQDIVIEYAKKYPDKIQLILRKKNLGMNENFVQTLQACKGQYIALLDGDDYWISPYKLKKQVDFLDTHPKCSICFHNVNVIYENDSIEPHPFHMQEPKYRISRHVPKPISTLKDIVPGNFMQTCSVMFRAGLFGDIPSWYCDLPTYDWPLHMLNAEHGDIGYLDEILGVYRVHSKGIWSMNMSLYRKIEDVERMINAYSIINKYFNFKYNGVLKEKVLPLHYRASQALIEVNKYKEARYHAQKCLGNLYFKLIMKSYIYEVHNYLKNKIKTNYK